jgi:Asp-tRNA(Asn)/Glu-tRNA(Gln) amidotransferase A subunit family amidase
MAAEGKPLPPLAGVPVAIKDVMVTRGVRTTAGSKILDNFIPPYDCTAVARLEAAGAVILGKLNCDEFAMGSSNENSAYHPVHNPRDKAAFRADPRADRRQRWRRTWPWRRSAPIPADRFASPHRFAAWSD